MEITRKHLREAKAMRLPSYTNKELDRISRKIFERIFGWRSIRFEDIGLNMRSAQQAHPYLFQRFNTIYKELSYRVLPLYRF